MREIFTLLKSGNKPSLLAAIVNAFLGIIKGIAFSLQEMLQCLLK